MIARYTRPEMEELWSDEAKYRSWLDVELAATEALARRGLVPQDDLKAIRQRAAFARISARSAVGTSPRAASASVAAISTSSHARYFASSVKSPPIAGRV